MSDKHDDGGPAFPRFHDGMSLRDWFAGQVLAGYSATVIEAGKSGRFDDVPDLHKSMAFGAYALADAMIAERSKP